MRFRPQSDPAYGPLVRQSDLRIPGQPYFGSVALVLARRFTLARYALAGSKWGRRVGHHFAEEGSFGKGDIRQLLGGLSRPRGPFILNKVYNKVTS